MSTYNIAFDSAASILKVGFTSQQAQNDQIVKDAKVRLEEMIKSGELAGGPLLRINGPMCLPVAFASARILNPYYETIAIFDPKIAKYVVCVAQGGPHQVGDLID